MFIDLPTTLLADLGATTAGVANDVMPLILLAIGLPLAFYVIRKAISVIGHKAK